MRRCWENMQNSGWIVGLAVSVALVASQLGCGPDRGGSAVGHRTMQVKGASVGIETEARVRRADRGGWIPKNVEVGKKCENLYFIGCSASFGSNRIPKSALIALETAGVDITLLGEKESCCGFPLFTMGATDCAMEYINKNVAAFREVGAKNIIASCPGCYKTLKHYLPDEFKVFHMEII